MTGAHFLESADGVVLIDSQMLPSDVRAFGLAVEATGKPVAGMIVTHAHYYVGEGRSKQILAALEHMKTAYAGVNGVYSGHSNPARITTISEQIRNVALLRGLVAKTIAVPTNLDDKGTITDEAYKRLEEQYMEAFPNYEDFGMNIDYLNQINIGGVIREMMAETKAK